MVEETKVSIFQRHEEQERQRHKDEVNEMLVDDDRLETLDMLEEMKKARGDED